MTLYETLDRYVESKWDLKEYSQAGIRHRVKRLKNLLADQPLESVAENLQSYINDWQTSGIADESVKNLVSILKGTLKKYKVPFEPVKFKSKHPKKNRCYDKEEIEKLEDFALKHKLKRTQIPLVVAMYTGMRIGEILALQWLDVDLDRGLIDISKDVVRCGGKTIIQTPKTKSSNRTVVIPPQLVDILKKFQPKADENWEVYVCSGKITPPCVRSASRCSMRFCEKAGVEWKGFHAFRHAYATNMMESGVSAKVVADLLGHSNTSTTLNTYSHASNDFKRECVDKVFEGDKYTEIKKNEKETLQQQILTLQKTINELLAKVASL